jgi:hypothetical protein
MMYVYDEFGGLENGAVVACLSELSRDLPDRAEETKPTGFPVPWQGFDVEGRH